MRKHKSVVAILLAVMMIFTFMPTMAFADTISAGTVQSWNSSDKFATLIDSNKHQFKATYYFGGTYSTRTPVAAQKEKWASDGSAWDGRVYAVVDDDSTSEVGNVYTKPSDGTWNDVRYFFDFDGSAFTNGSTTIDKKDFAYAGWTALQSNLNIQLVAQNYADYENYKVANAKKFNIPLRQDSTDPTRFTGTFGGNNHTSGNGLWTIVVRATKYDTKKTNEDQQITFTVEDVYTRTGETSGTVADGTKYEARVGSMPSATINVKATPKTPSTASYYFDKVGGESITGIYYDGAEHTVVADPVEGWTVTYKVYDKEAGDYVDKAVKATNAGRVRFQAVWTKTSSGEQQTVNASAYINAVNAPKYTFDINSSVADNTCNYNIEGTEYNALSYLVVKADQDETPKTDPDDETDRVLYNAASKSAVEANSSELMNYFADFYEIEEKTMKSAAYDVQLTVKQKTLTTTQRTELEKKYKDLMSNFKITTSSTRLIGTYEIAQLFLNADKVDEEIEFTNAPSSKVVHVKKAKKLKKNVSFVVEAVSNKGRTVSYKLTNANSKIKIDKTSGTITLKKGLAKGTYKIKVKAYVAGKSNAAGGSIEETQAITIKVKK